MLNQADLDAGSLTNVAQAFADGTASNTDTETVTAVQNPAIDLVKSADPTIYSLVGEVITYTLTVTNVGNVTLSDVVVSDPLLGLSASIGTLAPGASQTGNGTYTVNQADIDAGSVYNVATATGADPNGGTVSDSDDETVRALKGTLVLRKVTTTASTQAFEFTLNPGGTAFSLANGQEASFTLAPGTYTITEKVPSGWSLISVTCNGESLGSGAATIILADGASVTCIFTNEMQQGHVNGRTRGFWGNNNGNAILDPDGNRRINEPVTIGGGDRRISVNTISTSNTILAGNACAQVITCTGTKKGQDLSRDLQSGTLDNLMAQTLALSYNIKHVSGFVGQPLHLFGAPDSVLTALGLTGSSTVEDALALANSLIAGSTAGGTTTQAQASAMSSLLGDYVNVEP